MPDPHPKPNPDGWPFPENPPPDPCAVPTQPDPEQTAEGIEGNAAQE